MLEIESKVNAHTSEKKVIEWKKNFIVLWEEEKRKCKVNKMKKMEKSSLNIKSIRNLLSSQGKSYKIPPDNYQSTEVKIINGKIIDATNAANNCSIEDIYSIKHHKSNTVINDNRCDRKRIHNLICGNFVKLISYYNSNFCLPLFTPISSR